jgi:hypothetical protein
MTTNVFGRDMEQDKKNQDLYASVKRIVDKSLEKEQESIGFKDISSDQSLKGVQSAYAEMVRQKK